MFTPVKIGVAAAAALAAAVPTSLALVDRSDRPADATEASFKPVRTEPIAAAAAPGIAPLAQPAGASIVAPDLATGTATVRSVPVDALQAKERLDAGFDQLATAPAMKPGAKLPLLPPDPLPQGVLPPVAVGTPYAVPAPAPEPDLDQRVGAVTTTLAAAAPTFEAPKALKVETVRIPQPKPSELKDDPNGEPGGDKVVVALADPEAKPATSAETLKEKYRDMVEAEAKKQGLPPKFALAVVEVASNWNAKKRGEDSMTGLTQIRLRTAKQFGYKGDQDDLWDPETNIRWGLRYLSGAYKKVDGDQCKALMKWQGGYLADSMTKQVQQLCGQVRQAMASKD